MSGAPKPLDERVREEVRGARDVNVSVSAGAGTGKTRLMVDRFVRLVRAGLPVDGLVVITFTKTAAAELRTRIRKALREESRESSECARALERFSMAWIGTIHAFAGRLLREFFHLTGTDPDFVQTESHHSPREVSRRWDEWLLRAGREELSRDWEALVRVPANVLREIALGLERLRWLTDRAMLGEPPETLLERFGREELADAERMLRQCRDETDGLYAGARAFVESVREVMRGMPEPDQESLAKPISTINLRSGKKASWESKQEAKKVFGRARKKYESVIAPALLAAPALDGCWRFCGALAEGMRSDWDADRSRLSFDDLLGIAADSLERGRALRELLGSRFGHVMVDEFQDTSAEQVRLLEAMLDDGGRLREGSLTVVADDKQSIYGWRRADIETYRAFEGRMEREGAMLRDITVNFRSTGRIVEFVNAFGRELFGGRTEEEEPFACDYRPIDPGPAASGGEPVQVIELSGLPEGLADAKGKAKLQAAWFADYVARGIERGDSPGDYALLLRSGTHMDRYVEALEGAGIDYFVEATRDFRRRLEVTDLRGLVRCLRDPSDERSWVQTLRSGFFGVADDDISLALASGCRTYACEPEGCPGPVRRANAVLRRLRESARSLPLRDFLPELLLGTALLPGLILSRHQVGRRLSNMEHLLEEVMTGSMESLDALLLELDDELAPSRTDEPSQRGGRGAVTISTIHKAKGLAWEHVVVPTHQGSTGGSRGHVLSHESGRRAALDLGYSLRTSGKKLTARTPHWSGICDTLKHRGVAEERRLLYVALTRPRQSLVLFTQPSGSSGTSAQSIAYRCAEAALAAAPSASVRAEVDWERLASASTGPGAAGRMTAGRASFAPPSFEVDPKVEGWQPEGAVVGDLVHETLSRLDWNAPGRWLDENGEALEELFGGHAGVVRELCLRFFRMDLPFAPSSSEVLGREYAYSTLDDSGRLQSRRIDLLLRTPGGLAVVDYKTDEADSPAAVDRLVEKYSETQRGYIRDMERLFGEPARGYLVFLRASAWREVAPPG